MISISRDETIGADEQLADAEQHAADRGPMEGAETAERHGREAADQGRGGEVGIEQRDRGDEDAGDRAHAGGDRPHGALEGGDVDADKGRAALGLEHRLRRLAERRRVEHQRPAASTVTTTPPVTTMSLAEMTVDPTVNEPCGSTLGKGSTSRPHTTPRNPAQRVADRHGHHGERKVRAGEDRSDEAAIDRPSEGAQQHDRERARGDEGRAGEDDQHIDHEGARHDEIALAEVHDRRRPIDDGHGKRDEGIERALRDAAHEKLA